MNWFFVSLHTLKKDQHRPRRHRSRGAAYSNSISSPPALEPPEVFEPVFPQYEISGERGGAKGAEIFFPFFRGYTFFTLYAYSQNTKNFLKNSKMF